MRTTSSLLMALALGGALSLLAVVAPGENLLLNGDFEAEQAVFPHFWTANPPRLVSFNATAGPGAVGALRLSNPEGESGVASVRQLGLRLVAGETYKMSAWVKTSDFASGHCGIIVHNTGWFSSQGVRSFPATSDGWQYLENTFALETSKDGNYGVALFAKNFRGQIEIAKVKLEAISAGALAKSQPSPILGEQRRLRLVPWSPLLNAIPLSEPRLSFHAYGRPSAGKDWGQYDAVFTLDGQEKQKTALQPQINVLDLSGVAAGDHRLGCAIRLRDSGEELFARSFVITLMDLPTLDTSAHRRLNNLVTEVLNSELAAQVEAQSFSFVNPKDGWIFVAVQDSLDVPELAVDIVGQGTLITAANERREAFRLLPRGNHRISVKGATAGGRLQVRAIAEIFNYPACAHSQVPQNGKYDWGFHVKHIFPAVTTLNGGRVPDEHLPELKERGLLWLANLGTTNPKDADDLLERLTNSPGLNHPMYDGVTCDEQFFGQANLLYYTEALWAYENPKQRLIYTWIVGKPGLVGAHNDFMSASFNASRSRGRLLFEAYCHSRPDEQDARDYLQSRMVDTMDCFKQFFPNAAAGTGMILGNFNQIPIISLDVNPEVDYKYYLDMQVNLLANHPSFRDLATTGYWGSYYDDEELYRWSFALMRHYCVEGHTGMLSEQYGYRYQPGHLRNGDFNRGLEAWQLSPAAADAIQAASFPGYGKNSQARWGAGGGVGDMFCLFKRREGQASSISQTATGLVPGSIYTLQFVTADYQDMQQKRFQPRRHGLTAQLGDGAELLPEQSYVFVDRRNSARKKDDGHARINLHHLRFRAIAESVAVSFSDADAAPGEELALNYIMLKPYFR
ncbi:MAG: hypothetical protein ACOX9E_09610 [Lentisphaeria bacterium]|jgi:hypothetical protein